MHGMLRRIGHHRLWVDSNLVWIISTYAPNNVKYNICRCEKHNSKACPILNTEMDVFCWKLGYMNHRLCRSCSLCQSCIACRTCLASHLPIVFRSTYNAYRWQKIPFPGNWMIQPVKCAHPHTHINSIFRIHQWKNEALTWSVIPSLSWPPSEYEFGLFPRPLMNRNGYGLLAPRAPSRHISPLLNFVWRFSLHFTIFWSNTLQEG